MSKLFKKLMLIRLPLRLWANLLEWSSVGLVLSSIMSRDYCHSVILFTGFWITVNALLK